VFEFAAAIAVSESFGFRTRVPSRHGWTSVHVDRCRNSAVGNEEFLGRKLTRTAALVDPLKPEVFQILDRLIEDDPRFRTFLEGGVQQ
jgi:hypothetical protein